jgi:hypothetical protein
MKSPLRKKCRSIDSDREFTVAGDRKNAVVITKKPGHHR